MSLIAAHGGKLISRLLEPAAAATATKEAASLPAITLSLREAFDSGDDRHRRVLAVDRFSGAGGFHPASARKCGWRMERYGRFR